MPMQDYAARQAEKKERYEDLADRTRRQAESVGKTARMRADAIPFGQPILVGHHSERRDRNFRDKIWRGFQKERELSKKADHYAGKAAGIGTGGISADDPEAVVKLKDELTKLEEKQRRMKEANAIIRRKDLTDDQKVGAMADLGIKEAVARELLKPDFCNRIGFADYQLSNNSANMRRIKGRIEQLGQEALRVDKEEEGPGYTYREDTSENRVMFIFPGVPPEVTRGYLKSNGFKWSPTRKAWVRQLNNAGIWAASNVRKYLDLPPAPKEGT